MHARQTIHLPSCGGVTPAVHHVQPDPPQVEQRSFSSIRLSLWVIGAGYSTEALRRPAR